MFLYYELPLPKTPFEMLKIIIAKCDLRLKNPTQRIYERYFLRIKYTDISAKYFVI